MEVLCHDVIMNGLCIEMLWICVSVELFTRLFLLSVHEKSLGTKLATHNSVQEMELGRVPPWMK